MNKTHATIQKQDGRRPHFCPKVNLEMGSRTDISEPKLDNDPELQAKFGRSSGNAEIGGLVLAEAPAEMVEQRNAYYNKVTEDQSAAVGVNFEKQNDPRMPVFSERKSTTTRGRG